MLTRPGYPSLLFAGSAVSRRWLRTCGAVRDEAAGSRCRRRWQAAVRAVAPPTRWAQRLPRQYTAF